MKKLLIQTIVLGVMISTTSVFAESYDDVRLPDTPSVSHVTAVTEKQEKMFTTSVARTKARGQQLIRERINSLQSNMTVINASKSLAEDQKKSLATLVATNVTGLTTLSTQLASSTDATSTKALINSIFTDFRIYGIVIPQVRLEKRIFDLQNHSIKLSDTFLKVQTKINEYKGKGKDVTIWQKSLDDAKVMVAVDMNTLANLSVKVMALRPSDYGTTSKMVIESANKDLKSVSKDFNTIARNLHKPKIMKNVVGTTTPSLPITGTTTSR